MVCPFKVEQNFPGTFYINQTDMKNKRNIEQKIYYCLVRTEELTIGFSEGGTISLI